MDQLYSYDDLVVGRRCLRQLRRRLEQRSSADELLLSQLPEAPKGSSSTHQFLERSRIEKAYIDSFLEQEPGSVVIHAGLADSLIQHRDDHIVTLYRQSQAALDDLSTGAIPALVNGLFVVGQRIILVDRLRRNESGGYRLELAKTASKLKDGYVREAGWVSQGLAACGLRIDEIYILLLDRGYRRGSAAFYTELRQKKRHKFLRQDAADELEQMIRKIQNGQDGSCRDESCPECGADRPSANDWGSIHNLHKSGGLSRQLSEQGILWVDELDQVKSPLKEKLKPHHWIQHRVEKTGDEHIDKPALRDFLDSLSWPLYFLDFECFLEALPSWDDVGVWEHVPFLYSLYRMDGDLTLHRHEHHLILPGKDRRDDLAKQLVADLGTSGSILVYGIHFERSIIKRLGECCAVQREALAAVTERLVDLQTPFANFSYYHPHQSGKISLKVLLPILSEQGYSDDQVSSGSQAFVGYYYLMHPELPVPEQWDPYARHVREDPETFYRQVVEYCDTDAYGLAYLVKALMKKAGIS